MCGNLVNEHLHNVHTAYMHSKLDTEHMYMGIQIQCNFSKPNTLRTKEMVQFREVSGLERFCMYSKYREQDLKTCPV